MSTKFSLMEPFYVTYLTHYLNKYIAESFLQCDNDLFLLHVTISKHTKILPKLCQSII